MVISRSPLASPPATAAAAAAQPRVIVRGPPDTSDGPHHTSPRVGVSVLGRHSGAALALHRYGHRYAVLELRHGRGSVLCGLLPQLAYLTDVVACGINLLTDPLARGLVLTRCHRRLARLGNLNRVRPLSPRQLLRLRGHVRASRRDAHLRHVLGKIVGQGRVVRVVCALFGVVGIVCVVVAIRLLRLLVRLLVGPLVLRLFVRAAICRLIRVARTVRVVLLRVHLKVQRRPCRGSEVSTAR
mmetsp:Transcript_46676/g.112176  ORF Transcript_46676/g.112176 Transcript_46676/m.112176 type:complete len:242 (+) Transcript_46676:514-1239(+)